MSDFSAMKRTAVIMAAEGNIPPFEVAVWQDFEDGSKRFSATWEE